MVAQGIGGTYAAGSFDVSYSYISFLWQSILLHRRGVCTVRCPPFDAFSLRHSFGFISFRILFVRMLSEHALIWLLFTLAGTLNRISAPRHTCRTTWIIHTLAQNSIIDSRTWMEIVARIRIGCESDEYNLLVIVSIEAISTVRMGCSAKGIDFVDKRQPESVFVSAEWMARSEHKMDNVSKSIYCDCDLDWWTRIPSSRFCVNASRVDDNRYWCVGKRLSNASIWNRLSLSKRAQQTNGGHFVYTFVTNKQNGYQMAQAITLN